MGSERAFVVACERMLTGDNTLKGHKLLPGCSTEVGDEKYCPESGHIVGPLDINLTLWTRNPKCTWQSVFLLGQFKAI